ncbi:MAG TPA: Ada metal-binding domain-containing protein [Chloroflexota bacterium]
MGADGTPYESAVPGTLGGNRRGKLYGRLDCRTALAALARGGYARDRVFFADEATAEKAGYRPCAVCLPERYKAWKAQNLRSEARSFGTESARARSRSWIRSSVSSIPTE